MYVSAFLSAERRRLVLSDAAWGCRKSLCPHNMIVLFCVKGHSHQVFLCLGSCGRVREVSLSATVETGFRPAVMPSIHAPHNGTHLCGAFLYSIGMLAIHVFNVNHLNFRQAVFIQINTVMIHHFDAIF